MGTWVDLPSSTRYVDGWWRFFRILWLVSYCCRGQLVHASRCTVMYEMNVFGISDSKYIRRQTLWDEWRCVSHCPTNWSAFLFKILSVLLSSECISLGKSFMQNPSHLTCLASVNPLIENCHNSLLQDDAWRIIPPLPDLKRSYCQLWSVASYHVLAMSADTIRYRKLYYMERWKVIVAEKCSG